VRLHVATDTGDGPPLVLLHGWPQHSGMWDAVVPELSQRFRCLALDLRGMGASPAPPDGYEKRTLAQDVLDTLDDLGIERARFIGHDWGAFVTALIAMDHPERIERGIMLAVPAPWDSSPDPRRLLGIAHMPIMASPLGPMVAATLGKQVMTLSGLTSEAAERYVAPMRADPARARAASLYYRTFLLHELPEAMRTRVEEPAVPIHVAGGDRDPVCRWSTMEKIPGAGHFFPDLRPQEVLKRAEAFL